MGHGRTRLSVTLSLALFAVLGIGVTAQAQEARLIVTDRAQATVPDVANVQVAGPEEPVSQPVTVEVALEGPVEDRELQRTVASPSPGEQRLVTFSWTPRHPGEHTLQATVSLGEEVQDRDRATVEVAPRAQRAGDGALPDSAPGTVQWAIAFGFLFFVARAGIDRAP